MFGLTCFIKWIGSINPPPPHTPPYPTNISLFTMLHIQVSTWASIHHDTLEHTSWFQGMSFHHVCIYMNLLPTFH